MFQMMHTIKGGWAGQTFALAACSDSGGKKARIRRSKEERKTMVESFIKTYQNSNNGNFPSLNLTHKEVGGSFYTVREIVREIIQENRVLGPAKFSDEQSYDNILEHYPLGSISIEAHTLCEQSQGSCEELVANSNEQSIEYDHQNPDRDQAVNGVIETTKDGMEFDGPNSVSHISSEQSPDSSEELVANFNGHSLGSEHQKLYKDQVVNVAIEAIKDDLGSDESSLVEAANHHIHEGICDQILPNLSGQLTGPHCQAFDSKPNGNVSEPTDKDDDSNEPVIGTPVSIPDTRAIEEHNQEISGEQIVHSITDFPGHGHPKLEKDQDVNGITQAIGEKVYEQPVVGVTIGEDSLDVKKGGAITLGSSNASMTHGEADIVVEKFPLRPIVRKFDDLEGRSEEQSRGTRTLKINKSEQDRVQANECFSGVVHVEVGADLAVSKNKSELMDKTVTLNNRNSSLEMSNCSSNKKPVFDIHNAAEIGAKVSFPSGAKSISDETTGTKDKPKVEGDGSRNKGSNSTLNRINLETWERTSELHAKSEENPVLAFFKAVVTAFVKFWSE